MLQQEQQHDQDSSNRTLMEDDNISINGINDQQECCLIVNEHGEGSIENNAAAMSQKFDMVETVLQKTEGRMQIFLAATCSFAFFVDASEVSMTSTLFGSMMKEFNITEKELVIAPSMTNLGMFFGSLIFAVVSDYLGRKNTLRASMLICCVFGLISSYMPTIAWYAAMRFLLGLGYGGNLLVATTLIVECVSAQYRGLAVMLTALGYGIGAVVITAITFAVVPAWGWRGIIRLSASLGFPMVVLLYFIPESPRYYLLTRDFARCWTSLTEIAEFNKKEMPDKAADVILRELPIYESITMRKRLEGQIIASFVGLGRNITILIPLASCWFFNSFANTINIFFPLHASVTYPKQLDIEYLIAITIACGVFAGSMAELLVVKWIGRLVQIRVGYLISVIVLIILGFYGAENFAVFYFVAFFNQLAEQFVIGTLYLYTPEVFPIACRQAAMGTCLALHRIAPVIAPFAIAEINESELGFQVTCFIFAGIFGLGTIMSLILRKETFNKPLPDAEVALS